MNKKHNRFRSHMPREQFDQLQGTEIKSKRTRFGKVFALGANRFQAVTYTDPVHRFNEKTREWDEMDNRFSATPRMKEAKAAWKQGIIPAVAHSDVLLECKTGSMDVACAMSGEVPFINLTDAEGRHLAWGIKDAMSILPEADDINDTPAQNVRSMREKVLDHLHGEVAYNGIFAGVDLRCKLDRGFKDELIFAEKESVRSITFLLESEGRQMELNEQNMLIVKDEQGEPVFRLQAPFMLDADEQRGEVAVQLESLQRGMYAMTYIPDEPFIETATFPVVLDPAIESVRGETGIEDTYVKEGSTAINNTLDQVWICNNTTYGTRYGYMRVVDLPKLGANHFITSAYMNVKNYSAPTAETPLMCSEVLEDWKSDQITFATQPKINPLYQDYCKFPADQYTWQQLDVTSLARKWYHGDNKGIVLTPRSSNPNTIRLQSSNGSAKPYFVVNYASLAGLESYLSYDNQPVGHAGTGSVSLANGNLIFAHADTSMNGNLMPVSVTHFYNSCDADKNEFALGYGWRTSMHQTLHMERINSENMYVYTDGDGTEHWFELDEEDSTQYVDMSGLSLTLKVGTDNKITITDKGDNYMVFDAITAPTDAAPVTAKKLICELHDAVGNKVVVTAVSTSYPLLIKKITDGANRETIFDYNSAYTQCTAIRTPWQTDPTKACTRFAYDNNGDLEFIYHEDERRSEYDYKVFDGFHLLEVAHAQTAEDDTTKAVMDLATVTYTYSNAAQDETGNNTVVYGLPYCITAAVVKGFKGDTELKAQDVTYTYGNHLTLVTDNLSDPDETKRKTLRFHFNDNGNRVSIDDELGYALYTGYDQDGENADAPINHATVRSRMQRLVKNLLVDPMFDADDSAWVKSSSSTAEVGRDASTFKFGQVSTKLKARTSGNYIQQTVTLTPDSDYTFSGYIRSSAEKAFLRVTYTVNGVVTTIDSDPVQMHADPVGKPYERTAVSFHLPAGATSATCAAVCIGSSGYAWASCMQLEEGLTCNHFNMIQNCDFTRQTSGSVIPKKWTLGENDASYVSLQNLSEVDAIDNLMAPGFLQNAYAVRLAGRYDRTITLYQEFRCEGSIGDRFTAGGWCKSFAKKMSEENYVYCRIDVQFTAAGSNAASAVWLSGGSVHFNYEEGNWQFASGSIVAPSNYVRIRFILHMGRQMNHTDFTGLYLYPEAFGTEYVYDKKGNRKLAVKMYKYDKTQRADSYEYDDCDNLIKKTEPGRAKSSVFYYGDTEDAQKKHQLLRAVAPEGAVSTYEYDAENGNLTASQIQNAESNPSYFIRTETTYTPDGNYVATQTDARGKVVTTVTDPDKGTVTSVTDPKGQTVAYTYDELRRVTNVNSTVQVNAEAGSRSYCNEYTYDEDTGLLSTVSHNTTTNDCDVTYTFGYDALGRKTTVNVGNVELSRNEYQNDDEQPHYGTLKKMTYGNGNTVENTYDDFNRVTAVHYNGEETPRYEYAYNAKGQVAHVTHNTTDDSGAAVKVVTESEYDLSDRPIRVKEHEGSKHVYSGELAYNDEFGVLSEFREKVGESRAEFVTTLSYDDQNRPIAMGYGSYGGSTTTIDKLNRMTYSSVNLGGDPFTSEYHFATGGHGTGSLTGLVTSITQSGGNCSYGYDDNGNIANATVNGKWTGYVYDALGQLIRVNDRSDTRSGSSGSVWTYEYDQGGNILSKKRYPYAEPTADNVLETTTFTYGNPNWKDQLTAVNGVPISYDAIGNPLNDGTWTYTWQNGRQLAGMSKSGMTVSFKYNAAGLRTRKVVNGVMTKYTLHGKNVVHMTRGNDSLHFFYDAQGKPAVVVYNGTAYAYVKNLQGDIIAILDSTGTAVVSYTYDAWGTPTGTTGSMATTLGVLNPFRYRGYVYDEETQLYYLRSRYYNPYCCRFLNADSVFSFNLFTYCKNSPITNADSAGHLSGHVSPMLVDYLHDLYPWYPWDWDKLLDQYRVVEIDTPYFDYVNLRSSPFIVNNYSPESNRVKKIYAEHVYWMFVVGDGQLEGNNVPDYADPDSKNPYRVWFQVLVFYDNGDGKPTVYEGYMAAEYLWMPDPDTVWCFDNDDLINLRNAPDATDNTNVLARIEQGTTVRVLHDNGDGWVYVSAEGAHGWMMDTFIPKH